MISHDAIWGAIDALAEKIRSFSLRPCPQGGPRSDVLQQVEAAEFRWPLRWPSTESLSKVLEATGATLDEFMGLLNPAVGNGLPAGQFPPQQSAIPLLGFAQAGAGGFFDDGGFPAGQGWDVVDFPAAPDRKAGCYALEVQGESMMPLYRDGDVLIVEPGAQVRRGDRVVVKTREGEVMAKVLQRQTSRNIELLSLNPDHPNRSFDLNEIEWVARIIWASQ